MPWLMYTRRAMAAARREREAAPHGWVLRTCSSTRQRAARPTAEIAVAPVQRLLGCRCTMGAVWLLPPAALLLQRWLRMSGAVDAARQAVGLLLYKGGAPAMLATAPSPLATGTSICKVARPGLLPRMLHQPCVVVLPASQPRPPTVLTSNDASCSPALLDTSRAAPPCAAAAAPRPLLRIAPDADCLLLPPCAKAATCCRPLAEHSNGPASTLAHNVGTPAALARSWPPLTSAHVVPVRVQGGQLLEGASLHVVHILRQLDLQAGGRRQRSRASGGELRRQGVRGTGA